MAESTATTLPSSLTDKSQITSSSSSSSWIVLFVLCLAPVAVSLLIYRLDEFDSAQLPEYGLSRETVSVPKHYTHLLKFTERVGEGLLTGPEDIAYDADAGVIYTGCDDGWIKRVTVTNESATEAKVENWVHVGGRPIGLAFAPDKTLIVAEALRGLIKVTRDRKVHLLSEEADGIKFGLIDGVDVAKNGVIYFTDASYKYKLNEHALDFLEGRPYGRLLSFDPSTNTTQVLVSDLYFANGVAVSPQQDFIVFCESVVRTCKKYYIQGDQKGSVSEFIDKLPGYPDNVRYDGEGKFWIALISGKTYMLDLIMRYPSMRKIVAILAKYAHIPPMQNHGGAIVVGLDGEVIAHYSDPGLATVTVGIKIEDQFYHGSLLTPYMSRVNLTSLLSNGV